MIATAFLIAALVLFILSSVGVNASRFNLLAAGLACWVAASLVGVNCSGNNVDAQYNGPERRSVSRFECAQTDGICARLWWLVARSDTTPTRFMLAAVASCWTVMLLWPGETLDRPIYEYMRLVAGENADLKWSACWAACAMGMWWRVFSSVPRPGFALFINSASFMMYASTAVAMVISRPFPMPAAIASDIVCILAAAWVLVRTHINNGPGWRDD